MKKSFIIFLSSGLLVAGLLPSCKKEFGSLNGPTSEDVTTNPTQFQLNNLIVGTESGMRNNVDFYLDAVGMMGREMYRFAGSEPRYTGDLLGKDDAEPNNNTFYLTNSWNSRYRVVKNCNLLIEGATNSKAITPVQRKGYIGFAKTIKAYELLLNLNLMYTNGVRVEVADPDNPGPFLSYELSLDSISRLLDEGKAELTGSEILFSLSSGFFNLAGSGGVPAPADLIKFNRALAARVNAYSEKWPQVLTALNESFFNLNGPLNDGFYHVYSNGPNDQTNIVFFPPDNTGEVRLGHPSYRPAAIAMGALDDRKDKVRQRAEAASFDDLTSNFDVWVYRSNLAPIPIIRNEELILLYAEAKAHTSGFVDAIVAINRIRTQHGSTPYIGAADEPSLITENLLQRRFSLYFEGHRWIDMRRYDRLNQLPKDRPGDDVFDKFPRPLTEGQ